MTAPLLTRRSCTIRWLGNCRPYGFLVCCGAPFVSGIAAAEYALPVDVVTRDSPGDTVCRPPITMRRPPHRARCA